MKPATAAEVTNTDFRNVKELSPETRNRIQRGVEKYCERFDFRKVPGINGTFTIAEIKVAKQQ